MTPLSLTVERSRHGTLYDSFSETKGTQDGSSYDGREYFRSNAGNDRGSMNGEKDSTQRSEGVSTLSGPQAKGTGAFSPEECSKGVQNAAESSTSSGSSRQGRRKEQKSKSTSLRAGLEFFRGLRGSGRRGSAKAGSEFMPSLQQEKRRDSADSVAQDMAYYHAKATTWRQFASYKEGMRLFGLIWRAALHCSILLH